MVTITLQFTSIIIEGKKIYKPASPFTKLFCTTKNVDSFDEEELKHLEESGYRIITDD